MRYESAAKHTVLIETMVECFDSIIHDASNTQDIQEKMNYGRQGP